MINKVILMGRLTADPELKQTTSGIATCRFTVAFNRTYKNEQHTDFISVVAWRQQAEFVSEYFSKGRMIIVEGSLKNNNYTDQNGVKHYSMDVHAEKVQFGESKTTTSTGEQASAPVAKSVQTAAAPTVVDDLSGFEEILSDGEVPF